VRAYFGENAVVIGGSIAGMMTARVLADHFERVIVFERDHIAEGQALHESIPQGNHLHALLLGGQQVLSRLYPGFADKLKDLVRIGTTKSARGFSVDVAMW
jgi:glycine/D-amino acid oxidase-like deaminating enzyme